MKAVANLLQYQLYKNTYKNCIILHNSVLFGTKTVKKY